MEEAAAPVAAAGAMVIAATAAADWLVIAPVVITIVTGALLLMLRSRLWLQPRVAVASLMVLVLTTGTLLARVLAEGPVAMTMGRWLPPFGITFAADALGATLAFTASVVALLVAIYAARDIPPGLRRHGFYPFLMLLMTGVSGAFLTGDIFNLYVWFEVLLIASFGMIVLGNSKAQLDGALRYAILNLIATAIFLIATGYLYGLMGTLNMADLTLRIRELDDAAPLATIAALFILGFGMKAAAFPLNFWLPASYHTPAAATSAIFAGLLTKVGIYALLRVFVMLMPEERALYSDLLAGLAIATMLIGALGALAQAHLRRMIGYFVIIGIGSILAGLATGSQSGIAAAIVYSVHSMLAMTAFYLAIGVAERLGGSSHFQDLGGLYLASPLLAALVLSLVFAAAGLPPFSGFWPKFLLTEAALAEGRGWLAAAILTSGILTTLPGARCFAQTFWRARPVPGMERPGVKPAVLNRRDSAVLLTPVIGLTLLILGLGLWPAPLLSLADISAAGLIEPALYIDSVFGP